MKKTLVLYFSIVALLFSTVQFVRADDSCKKGKDALDKGDFIAAIAFLRDGVQNDKKNAQCAMWLGMALLGADSADAALAALVDARDLDSANAKVYVLLGDAYEKQGIHAAAIDQYKLAATYDSTDATIYKKLAAAAFKGRKYTDAATALVLAIRLDTTDTDLYRQLGHLYYRDAEARKSPSAYEKVIPILQKVVERDPKDTLRMELLKSLSENRFYKDLIPLAVRITAEDSSQTEVMRTLATAYSRTADNDNAAKVLGLIVGEHPDAMKPEDYQEYGKVLQALHRNEEAVAAYEKALAGDTTLTSDIAYSLGTLYMETKDYPSAIKMFEKKIELDTTSGYQFASHLNAAICLMQGKEYERARVHILKSLEYRPEYVGAWRALAEDYAQIDSSRAERDAYKKVLELAASGSVIDDKNKDAVLEAYRMEGFFLLLTDKKYTASCEMLKKAIAIDPKDCQSLLWLAQASALNKQVDEAKKYYCKVIANCSKNEKLVQDASKGLTQLGGSPDDCGK